MAFHNFIRITILAYFLTGNLNLQMLRGKEMYLLNSLFEKLKKQGFFKTCVNSKESVSSKDKQIK